MVKKFEIVEIYKTKRQNARKKCGKIEIFLIQVFVLKKMLSLLNFIFSMT